MILFIQQHWQEITGASFGLLYLYFEYKADIKMWPTGIIMSLFYVYVFIDAGFYAFAGINTYYIVAQIYGWYKWGKGSQVDKPIGRFPSMYFLPILGVLVVLFLVLAYLLMKLGESPVAWGDSFITSLNIIAIWMLMQKHAEQWIPLIIANVASIFIFLWQGLYPTSFMYLVYAVVSVFGYFNWRNMADKYNR